MHFPQQPAGSAEGSGSGIPVSMAEWAFLVLVFSLAFMRPNVVLFGSTATATDFIFAGCCVLFAIALVARQASFKFDRIYIWLGLYVLALSLAAAFSIDAARSFKRLPAEIYLIALAVLTINIVRDQRMLMKTLTVWLVAASVTGAVSVLTAASFFAGWENAFTAFAMHYYGTLPPGNYPRIQGTFEYPSILCNYLTVGLMILLAFRHMGRIGGRMFALLLAVFSIAIFFTLTPGIGGVLAAAALWIYLISRASHHVVTARLAVIGVAGSIIALILVSSLTPFGSAGPVYFAFAGYDFTPSARLLTWQQAIATFAGHPIFGVGLGLPVVNLPYQLPSGAWALITDAHNVALNVGAQAGLVGLAAIAGIAFEVIRRASLSSKELTDLATIRIALGVAFVSCFVVQGLVGSFENARHLWVLIGLVVAAANITPTPPPIEEPHA